MHYSRLGQWVVLSVSTKVFPIERFALAASIQPFPGHVLNQVVELLQRAHVTADTIILIMASKLSTKNRPPFFCLHTVPYCPKPGAHLLALNTEFLLTGLVTEDKLPRPILTTVMGESKKVKGVGSPVRPARPLSFKPAKTNYASFLRM